MCWPVDDERLEGRHLYCFRESRFRWPDTRCDGVVGRWPLGSGALAHALNLADPHRLLARSGDRVGLTHRDSLQQYK